MHKKLIILTLLFATASFAVPKSPVLEYRAGLGDGLRSFWNWIWGNSESQTDVEVVVASSVESPDKLSLPQGRSSAPTRRETTKLQTGDTDHFAVSSPNLEQTTDPLIEPIAPREVTTSSTAELRSLPMADSVGESADPASKRTVQSKPNENQSRDFASKISSANQREVSAAQNTQTNRAFQINQVNEATQNEPLPQPVSLALLSPSGVKAFNQVTLEEAGLKQRLAAFYSNPLPVRSAAAISSLWKGPINLECELEEPFTDITIEGEEELRLRSIYCHTDLSQASEEDRKQFESVIGHATITTLLNKYNGVCYTDFNRNGSLVSVRVFLPAYVFRIGFSFVIASMKSDGHAFNIGSASYTSGVFTNGGDR